MNNGAAVFEIALKVNGCVVSLDQAILCAEELLVLTDQQIKLLEHARKLVQEVATELGEVIVRME